MGVHVLSNTGIYESGAGSGVAALDITGTCVLSGWFNLHGSSTGHFPLFAQGNCATNLRCLIWQMASGGGFRLITANTVGSDVNSQSGGNRGLLKDAPEFHALMISATDIYAYRRQVEGPLTIWRQAFAGSTFPPSTPTSRSTNILSDTITKTGGGVSDFRIVLAALTTAEIEMMSYGHILGKETFVGYRDGSTGYDFSGRGNHIPDMSGIGRIVLSDWQPQQPLPRRRRAATAAATVPMLEEYGYSPLLAPPSQEVRLW